MAITYNNLYLDIRQQLHAAGLPAATLEARELVCCAAGKSREELTRDSRLYVPDTVERQARQLVEQGGVLVNDEKVPNAQFAVTEEMLKAGVKIRKGKKIFHKAVLD